MKACVPVRQMAMIVIAVMLVLPGVLTGGTGLAIAQVATPGATPVATPSEVTVSHAQDETVVPFNPEVVLSFDLASVDTLDALGVQVDGLPKANLSGSLEKFAADQYQNIGTLFEPDYEVVNGLQPDLIIVAGRLAEAYPELAKIAPTIDLTSSGDLIAGLTTNVTTLASIFGKQAEASQLLQGINGQVERLRAETTSIGTGLVIMTSGGEVTAIAPGGNRGGLIYGTLGVTPPVEDVEAATHGEAISFEFLLQHNPDWLFVIDRDVATGSEEGVAAEQVLDNEIVH